MLIHASLPGKKLRKKTKHKSNHLLISNQVNQSDHLNHCKWISERLFSIPGK